VLSPTSQKNLSANGTGVKKIKALSATAIKVSNAVADSTYKFLLLSPTGRKTVSFNTKQNCILWIIMKCCQQQRLKIFSVVTDRL
jgi:hypothetical protein